MKLNHENKAFETNAENKARPDRQDDRGKVRDAKHPDNQKARPDTQDDRGKVRNAQHPDNKKEANFEENNEGRNEGTDQEPAEIEIETPGEEIEIEVEKKESN